MFRKKASRFLSAVLVSALVASSLGGYTSKAEDSTETGEEILVQNEEAAQNEDNEIIEEDQTGEDVPAEETESQENSSSEVTETPVQEESVEPFPENGERLEHVTGMDADGNVYEISDEAGIIKTSRYDARAAEAQIVNFNTKGSSTTDYKEVETGVSGYTCGTYGADAAYLGTSSGKVKFMLSGVIGEVDESEVQIVGISDASSISYYTVSSGRLMHYITTNVSKDSYGSKLDNGPAPSYLKEGTKYYSYDGHYFYTYSNFDSMISDYNNGTRTNSVNPNSPYFNYYQYLPLRSKTNYSASEMNDMINAKTDSDSKMRNIGNDLVTDQNTYGVNALMMTGVAANESAWGSSNIAQSKNNLFGLNAVDSSPGESANYYSDVATCIKDFAETYMSKRYLRSGYTYYKGAFLGNKASGINVHYASDPYWGEKAANVAWNLDNNNGQKDYEKYTIGIKDLLSNKHTTLNVRNISSTDSSSTVLYKTVSQSQYAFLILNNGTLENGFYKVQSDPVLNSERTEIDTSTGNYNFSTMYAYAHSDYVTIVHNGNGSEANEPEEPDDTPEWDTVTPVSVPSNVADVLTVTPYVEEYGWLSDVKNGEQAGTTGISHQMEAIKMKINGIAGLGIEYSAHLAGTGWQDYVADGETAGSTGQDTAMQAIKIRLTGSKSDEYDIFYRAHVQTYGWQDYVSSDEIAGTTGESKDLQALQIVIVEKEKDISVDSKDLISYSAYTSTFGWGGAASRNGEQAGVIGMSLPIESIKIESGIEGVGVEYSTHIPNVGWQDYVADGEESKVTDSPKRIEAIRVRLTGKNADDYDVYYRVHCQKFGWLGWAKNDEKAGSQGYSYRIEALQIVVVKAGSEAPGSTEGAFKLKPTDIVYTAYVNGDGWQDAVRNGESAGTTGQSKALGGLKVVLENKVFDGSVQYSGHIQNKGWDVWRQNGAVSGTADGTKRFEAVKMQLTDEMAENYDIYYRVHCQQFGWLGWAKNGQAAGTEGYSYRVEAIEIRLVTKGDAAPGSTDNTFKKRYASVKYSAHVQRVGWQSFVSDGAQAGTVDQGLRMEALKIQLANLNCDGGIKYSAHVQGIGWQSYVSDGEISGTVGKQKRVEAIKIQLTGDIADYCDVYYRVNVPGYGWLAWTKNGESAGTEGYSKQMEAIQIKIVTKGEEAPSTAGTAFYKK